MATPAGIVNVEADGHNGSPMPESINPVERARRRATADGRIRTLVNTSFAAVGIRWPEERYRTAWEAWRTHPSYTPTGRGGIAARTALAEEIRRWGTPAEPEDFLLTAGSSISYHLVFSLLRRGPDAPTVALPVPGYPLFEGIMSPLGMEPVWYHCPPETGFLPDPTEIQRLVTGPHPPPAALVLISPNNPAGVTYPHETVTAIVEICAAAGVMVIIDEVFSLFRTDSGENDLVTHDTSASPVPVVHLNGFSKLCAAPEVKLGWIMVSGGDSHARSDLVEALDTEHDTYLSLSGFAEAAVEPFIAGDAALAARRRIRTRVTTLRTAMRNDIDSIPGFRAVEVNGGIHLPVRLDPVVAAERFGTVDDESIAATILNSTGVFLHPGYFYGLDYPRFGGTPWFVVSALTDDDLRREACAALSRLVSGRG
ncbi:MAG: aminotransferase class I/II-fold pyridoxal phosphate-dependent enzyme [Alkalispirochaeta sp.]